MGERIDSAECVFFTRFFEGSIISPALRTKNGAQRERPECSEEICIAERPQFALHKKMNVVAACSPAKIQLTDISTRVYAKNHIYFCVHGARLDSH
jgi:hypothetical protein